MGRRKKNVDGMADVTQPKTPTMYGLPSAQLDAAAASNTEALVKIARRNLQGRFSTLGQRLFSFQQTNEKNLPFIGAIDSWLQDWAGGGDYLIRPCRIDNINLLVEGVPQFHLTIAGQPKPATLRENGMDATGGIGAVEQVLGQGINYGSPTALPAPEGAFVSKPVPPELYATLPPHVQVLPVGDQWLYLNNQHVQKQRLENYYAPPPLAFKPPQFSSDELAHEQTQRERQERDRLHASFDQERQRMAAKIESLGERLAQTQQQQATASVENERKLMLAKMEAMEQRMKDAQSSKPTFDMTAVLGLATAFAPVLGAMVVASKDRANAQTEAQLKAQELQMKALAEMNSRKPDDSMKGMVEMLKFAVPLLTPLVGDAIKSRGPEAQASALATASEAQMTSFSMIAQLVEQLAKSAGGSQDPPWLPAVQGLLGTAMQATEAWVASKTQQQPAKQLAAGVSQQPVGTVQQQISGPTTPGQQVAAILMNLPQMPSTLKTQAWFDVLADMHDLKDPEELATRTANLLAEMNERGEIPAAVAAKFEETPKEALMVIFGPMPVNQQHPEYVDKVVDLMVESLTAAEDEAEETAPVSNGASAVTTHENKTPFTALQGGRQPQRV